MKARVKATGEIVEVKSRVVTSLFTGKSLLKYIDQNTGISYFEEELFFPKDLVDDPDYWTRLEHQYAGMAMQGMVSCRDFVIELGNRKGISTEDALANAASTIAHALVEKMKEEK